MLEDPVLACCPWLLAMWCRHVSRLQASSFWTDTPSSLIAMETSPTLRPSQTQIPFLSRPVS